MPTMLFIYSRKEPVMYITLNKAVYSMMLYNKNIKFIIIIFILIGLQCNSVS